MPWEITIDIDCILLTIIFYSIRLAWELRINGRLIDLKLLSIIGFNNFGLIHCIRFDERWMQDDHNPRTNDLIIRTLMKHSRRIRFLVFLYVFRSLSFTLFFRSLSFILFFARFLLCDSFNLFISQFLCVFIAFLKNHFNRIALIYAFCDGKHIFEHDADIFIHKQFTWSPLIKWNAIEISSKFSSSFFVNCTDIFI